MRNLNPSLQFKKLLKKKSIMMAGVYDCYSALLAQQAGFKAIYLSGGALSVSRLGKPDIGLLTLDEVLETARRITEAVSLPLIVDVDTGFGGEVNIRRCVEEMESIGVAGIQIEDQVFPKRCGHLKGKSVISASEMTKKLKTAVKSRKNPHFLIVGRTDARAVEGLQKAVARSVQYKKAGADIIFPEALQYRREFEAFSVKKGIGPLLANMTEFGISPALTFNELEKLGYKVVLFPMTAFRAAGLAMKNAYKTLKTKGQSRSFVGKLQTRRELYDLIDYEGYNRRERKWLKQRK